MRIRSWKVLVPLGLVACAGGYAAWIWWELGPDPAEPERLAVRLGLKPGMTVGEIGAGDGKTAVELARRVGPAGRLIATEIEESKLGRIRKRAEDARAANLTVTQAGVSETNLPDASCDAIYLSNVYHHFSEPAAIDASMYRALKPGGLVAVIDFEPRKLWPLGQPSGLESRGGHGMPRGLLVQEMKAAGFEVVEEIPQWARGRFCVVFRRPSTR